MAGPVFRSTMEGALRLMDVAPDNLDAWLAVQDAAEAKRAKAAGQAAPKLAKASTVAASKLPAHGGVQ